jgi:asparagine synthase (glutamine-hydrolysing)
MNGPAKDFVGDLFSSEAARGRELFRNEVVLEGLGGEQRFGRKGWGMLSLELWQRAFHDRASGFRGMLDEGAAEPRLRDAGTDAGRLGDSALG